MTFFRTRAVFGFFVVLASATVFAVPSIQAQDTMIVGVDPVISETTHQTLPVLGRFVARQAGVVAARINGPVATFHVEVGDRVKTGDVLAVLIKDRLKWLRELQAAEVTRYQAARTTAGETLKLRQQEMRRLEGLRKSAAFSQARLEDKRQEVAVAQAEIAQADGQLLSARANLQLAEINLFNADITAPYDGVVIRRHSEAGAFVDVGAPLVSLLNDSNLEIEADVPVRIIDGLIPGTQVQARHTGGSLLMAEVRAVIPNENPQTRTRTVRFVTLGTTAGAGGGPRVAANQSVTLLIPATGDADTLTVHKDAVLNRLGKTVVFLHQDGKAVVRPVRLGEAAGSRMTVLSGLKKGDLVVVRGNERLHPDQPISFRPPATNAAAAIKPKG